MLEQNHQQLVKGVNCSFMRYLHEKINWNDQLIGIFGTKGVGVTTLMLQHIKMSFALEEGRALYLDMDSIWFKSHTLREEALSFYNAEGTHLFLDDVHLYPNWKEEIAELYDRCPNLAITFSISSLHKMDDVRRQMRRNLACYQMKTMSFREFLAYESLMEELPAYPLNEILKRHASVVATVNTEINVVPAFRNYLEHGCYPFYWQDPDAYHFRIQQNVTDMIRRDLTTLANVSLVSVDKIQRLLLLLAQISPVYTCPSLLAKDAGLSLGQTHKYLDYLQRMGLIRIPGVVPSVAADAEPQLPKLYMGNTNLSVALFRENEERTAIAETFFVDQLSGIAQIKRKENNDFLVDGDYSFMVGDPLRDYERCRSNENTFAAVHGLPKSIQRQMPIWTLGLCY